MFLLQDAEGTTDPNHVLKVVFKYGIGGLFGMTNLEREWRVGRQLALLTEPGMALPGFMGTGAGVVTTSGQFTGNRHNLTPAFALSRWQRLTAPTRMPCSITHSFMPTTLQQCIP